MKIGARVWKTALAVTLAIVISRLLHLDRPVFAGIAAIICMQPTITGSLRKGFERMQATIMGAVFSLLALILISALPFLQPFRPVMIGLTVLVVMVVTLRLGWLDSLVLAAATVVVIMILPADENIYAYSLSRTVVTLVGIVVATAVNAVFMIPRYAGPLWNDLVQMTKSTGETYRRAVEAFCRRDIELARATRESLEAGESLLSSVSLSMQRIEDETRLRETIRRPYGSEIEILGRAIELLRGIRQSTSTILRVAIEALEKSPKYAEHAAHVYDILWDLAQLSFKIFNRIEARFSEESPAEESIPSWSDAVHQQLIRSIREAYSAPREIFPLIEVSVVAFEIRRATENLAELDAAVARLVSLSR